MRTRLRVLDCAHAVVRIGESLLGADAEIIGETHPAVRFTFGTSTSRVMLLGHFDTVWPIGTLARWPFSVTDGVATGTGRLRHEGRASSRVSSRSRAWTTSTVCPCCSRATRRSARREPRAHRVDGTRSRSGARPRAEREGRAQARAQGPGDVPHRRARQGGAFRAEPVGRRERADRARARDRRARARSRTATRR